MDESPHEYGSRASEPGRGSRPTSERVSVEGYQSSRGDQLILAMHVATYRFAKPFVVGKDVLDFGCGTGYGTAILASEAKSATGVDIAPEAVEYASGAFSKPNIRWKQIEPVRVAALPFGDNSFDVVTSFQVIEHIDETDSYLDEIRRVLRPGGSFLCVTPDRTLRLFPGQRPWNEFHCFEYTPAQLQEVLSRRFSDVALLRMGAQPEIIELELARYRRIRLLSYPFTFPHAPDSWRRAGIRLSKNLANGRQRSVSSDEPAIGPEDILIGASLNPSVNIVAIATGIDPYALTS